MYINPFIYSSEDKLKDGLIISVYGQGTIINNELLKKRILKYQKNNKPIIIISQSIKNKLNIDTYGAGEFLKEINVINASGSFVEECFGCINYLVTKNRLLL